MFRNLKITYRVVSIDSTDVTYGQKATIENGFLVVWYSDTSKAHISLDLIVSIEADNRFYKPGY